MNAGGAPVPANLWGGGAGSLRVRLASGASPDFQIVRLEDLTRASNEITVTPGLRHLMLTNLFDWLAPQFATPVSGSSLARFSRGNKVTPFADGPDFFDDMFREIERARTAGGGFHLAGWSMFPEDEFTRRRDGEPADFALSLLQAVERIGAAGGGCRFLPAKFIQLQDSDSLTSTEILVFNILVYGVFILNAVGVSAVRTDGAGVVVLMALVLANAFYVSYLLSEGGRPLEQNKSAVEKLEAADKNSFSRFSPYPARVEDNTLAPPLTDFPFDVLFQITRHFGVYHQKFSVVKTAASHVGYCGGIDVHPNRLDDANHLAGSPFHDIHARVDGPAMRDLALTFEQRWARDGGGTAIAFPTPAASALGAPGKDVVQVARTYFAPADASRRLNFAPAGDRTIADTLLKAIAGAREFIYIEEQYFTPPAEYNTALINKVASGDLRLLVVVLPSLNDQPVPISFGQCVLSGMPCRAVHDFSLIPSPKLVPNNFDWIRHTVEPWAPSLSGPLTGLFAVRSVDIDSQEEPFKDASQWLNRHSEKEAAAEFVLDDTVVPFFSPWVIPVPRHITIGVRRRVLDPSDAGQVFKFDRAPVQIVFRRDPAIILIVESFFFKSLPSEELSRDLGLSFSAGLVFADKQTAEGDPKIDQHALLIELGENYTPRIGYRREFSSADNLPAPGTGAGQVINRILHWEIATIQIDIMAFRIGYSLGRAIGEDASFGDSAEATIDLFISMPPTGGDDSFFKLRSLNGEKVAFAIEGLGWRQGSFQLKGVVMPDGVVAMFGPVKIIIQEIGLLAENGASYLSFSAGVAFPLPSGFEGAIAGWPRGRRAKAPGRSASA